MRLPCRGGDLRFGVLNPIHQPEIKHRRSVTPGMTTAGYRQASGRDLMKAWDTGEDFVYFPMKVS